MTNNLAFSCAICNKNRRRLVQAVFCNIILFVIAVLLFSLYLIIVAKIMQSLNLCFFVHNIAFLTNSYLAITVCVYCIHTKTVIGEIYVEKYNCIFRSFNICIYVIYICVSLKLEKGVFKRLFDN